MAGGVDAGAARMVARLAGAAVVLGFAVAAVRTVYRFQPVQQWLPDLVVGLAAVCLAVVSWRRWAATSTLALLVAGCWWAGTVWAQTPYSLSYWHRGAFAALVLSAPGIRPRSRTAAAVLAAVVVASLVPPVWGYDGVSVAAAVAVLVGGLAETRVRAGFRWVVAPALLALAIGGAAIADALGVAAEAYLAGYCAVLVAALLAVGIVVRAPQPPTLTDLAVELGPESVRDVDTLMRLVRAEPGLEADLRSAIDAARRWEAANTAVRTELRAAVVEVTDSRRRLVTAEAEQRARLAAEVDGTTVGALRTLVRRADDAGVAPGLRRALSSLEGAVTGLRPPGLDDGVAVAVRDLPLVAELGARLDVADARCPAVVEDTLFAVAAEALSNVAKYAGRCRVRVRYAVVGGLAELSVADDGAGGAEVGGGSGLVSLTDRIEALGGRFTVVSGAGTGTTVTATVPVAGTLPGAGWCGPRETPPA